MATLSCTDSEPSGSSGRSSGHANLRAHISSEFGRTCDELAIRRISVSRPFAIYEEHPSSGWPSLSRQSSAQRYMCHGFREILGRGSDESQMPTIAVREQKGLMPRACSSDDDQSSCPSSCGKKLAGPPA
jgi:hypothetical protein